MGATRETAREWVARWRTLGPILERERATEFASADLTKTMAAFESVLRASLQSRPPSPDSGLIEQQRLFRILRRA
ncbi:MAG: hypothetical protein ACREH8_12480 [Opitutaceae bacterium]